MVMSFIVTYIDDCDDSVVTRFLKKARALCRECMNIYHGRVLV